MQERTMVIDIWTYGEPAWSEMDLSGFDVEARDGGIGRVDEATHEAGTGHLIVDTGPWIFGRKVMLPAGFITGIDTQERRLFVDLTKDQIKSAPEFDESRAGDAGYRDELGTYYGANRPAGPDYGKDDLPT